MTLENKTALVIKELLTGWTDDIINLLVMSDYEIDKVYSFDANEALEILKKFIEKYDG